MSEITQCPQCGTRFKVTREQRESHQGMVRCGRCQAVFNAAAHLYDDTPSPQLALPIDLAESVAGVSPSEPDTAAASLTENSAGIDAKRVSQDFSYLEDVYEVPEPIQQGRRWPWVTASALLLLLLAMQASYFYRVEIAARLPEIKPAMMGVCSVLRCSIPLPQHIEMLNLESSSMEADPTQANIITLSALLRNSSPYALAYPNIELTLTSLDDKPLARRTFRPQEYLAASENEHAGLPASREASVRLHLNTSDLKPAGYRLYLLYPQ